MHPLLFLLFLISSSYSCEEYKDCDSCQLEGCYFLKLYNGENICSSYSWDENVKYKLENCVEIRQKPEKQGKSDQDILLIGMESLDNEMKKGINDSITEPQNITYQKAYGEEKLYDNFEIFPSGINDSIIEPQNITQLVYGEEKLYSLRMQRNFCHQVRILNLMKNKNQTLWKNILKHNPIREKKSTCDKIILQRKLHRLENCTACSLKKPESAQLSQDCQHIKSCRRCVLASCVYIIIGKLETCSDPFSPNTPGSIVVNFSEWCPSSIEPQAGINNNFQVGFWVLLALLLATLIGIIICIIIRLRKNNDVERNEALPLSSLDNMQEIAL